MASLGLVKETMVEVLPVSGSLSSFTVMSRAMSLNSTLPDSSAMMKVLNGSHSAKRVFSETSFPSSTIMLAPYGTA